MKKLTMIAVLAIFAALAGCAAAPVPTPPSTDHPPVREFSKCDEMHKAGWKEGVNRAGGTYKTSWDKPEMETYSLNTSRDRDKDGHACE